MADNDVSKLGAEARHLLRCSTSASLATLMDGAPYASLVMLACDYDGTPILLTSSLAQHRKNFEADAHVSLLIDQTLETANGVRLTGSRVSLQGTMRNPANENEQDRWRARYLARQPDAADYVNFADFAFFGLEIERAHLVAGFGRIHWIEGTDLLWSGLGGSDLADAEPGVIAHMNDDHSDALAAIWEQVRQCPAAYPVIMTGLDAEGIDMSCNGQSARQIFPQPLTHSDQIRSAIVTLTRAAR